MAVRRMVPIADLHLDLGNLRTLPQTSEVSAVQAMIAIGKNRFWALCDSFHENGILPTENIIVLDEGSRLIVKEGNRRIAVMKLLHGMMPLDGLSVPNAIRSMVAGTSDAWKQANAEIQCAVYAMSEADAAENVVKLAHAKGQEAGRAPWTSVARAREHRRSSPTSEPGLDLLEKYLQLGLNLTVNQKDEWAGDYPLTVLDEILRGTFRIFGGSSQRDLIAQYPNTLVHRRELEMMLHDIGSGTIGFNDFRREGEGETGIARRYGLTPAPGAVPPAAPAPGPGPAPGPTPAPGPHGPTSPGVGPSGGPGGPGGPAAPPAPAPPVGPRGPQAVPLNDPKSVIRQLKKFYPIGQGRDKVVLLLVEARKLKLETHPHAFCFLLRSMFEISAKAYCADHQAAGGPSATKPTGEDRRLVDVLKDVAKHMIGTPVNTVLQRELHGAVAELSTPDSLLSVTSMNQLIHHPTFSVTATHISTVFHNVFPLLKRMNT